MASSTFPPNRRPSPPSNQVCPRCGIDSYHALSPLFTNARPNAEGVPHPFVDVEGAFKAVGAQVAIARLLSEADLRWYASVCVSCGGGAVWRGAELMYPRVSQVAKPHPAMPAGARELYEEAALVMPVSRRAAAALARAALERLLRALPDAQPGARLDGLIAALYSRVSHPLWQTLTALRYLGNDTLHAETSSELVALYLDGDAADVAEPVFEALNAIVEEVIVRPRVANDLYSKIPQSVREAAERKRDQ